MSLTKNQFDILACLEQEKGASLTQRELVSRVNKSLGTVNKTVTELGKMGYVEKRGITEPPFKASGRYLSRRALARGWCPSP